MAAGYTNIIIEAGSDFSVTMDLTDSNDLALNLTGYTGTCTIRRSYTSDLYVYPLTITIPSPYTNGRIIVSATAVQTAAMRPNRYVYTIDIKTGSSTRRIVEGIAEVRPSANN